MAGTKWIFFDCFNTLIDDFDPDGDESGVKPLGEVAVREGWCDNPLDFHAAYLDWRKSYWDGTHWNELPLLDRLKCVLEIRGNLISKPVEEVAEEMVEVFHQTFPPTVRPAPGVVEMLDRLHGAVQMGVVSNFFLPGMPQSLLDKFDLAKYFDFILDSAQVGIKKPTAGIYAAALEKANLKPDAHQSVLFIGDSIINDYHSPKALGMNATYFDRSNDRPSPPAKKGIKHILHWDQFHPF